MKAVEQNHKSIAKLLIRHGVDVNKAIRYEKGYKILSPLKTALMNKNYDMAILLINAKAYDEGSFLYAAEIGYTEILKVMIENGADINIKNRNQLTALDLAKANKRQETVNLLEKYGAISGE